MKWKYRCEVCGCYMDPGEGWICEDCKQERENKKKCIELGKQEQEKRICLTRRSDSNIY